MEGIKLGGEQLGAGMKEFLGDTERYFGWPSNFFSLLLVVSFLIKCALYGWNICVTLQAHHHCGRYHHASSRRLRSQDRDRCAGKDYCAVVSNFVI